MGDPWIDDESIFRGRLEKGERQTKLVAERLRRDGLEVEEPEKSFRREYKDRHNYRDEVDLVVNGCRVEVKSRPKLEWTTLDDFPYPDIIVDTVRKWDGHKTLPVATINVCPTTGAIIVVPGKTKGEWREGRRLDSGSGHEDDFYFAPRRTWTTYEKLVEFLRTRA